MRKRNWNGRRVDEDLIRGAGRRAVLLLVAAVGCSSGGGTTLGAGAASSSGTTPTTVAGPTTTAGSPTTAADARPAMVTAVIDLRPNQPGTVTLNPPGSAVARPATTAAEVVAAIDKVAPYGSTGAKPTVTFGILTDLPRAQIPTGPAFAAIYDRAPCAPALGPYGQSSSSTTNACRVTVLVQASDLTLLESFEDGLPPS